jgi:tyrosyl-tRNA synthetase
MGRNLQRESAQEPQVVITTPLLEGLDGVQKMSKSLNNYIGISDAPNEMFGKIMSISDDLMWKYFELLTDLSPAEIKTMKTSGENPRNLKVNLAKLVIEDFHSGKDAQKAEDEFNRRFVNKEIPDEIEEMQLAAQTYKLVDLLVNTNLVASKGEAKRLVEQGGVKIDSEKISNLQAEVEINSNEDFIVQVGKRKFLKLKGI